MILNIRVSPRSSQNKIVGAMADGALKITLTAAPVDGAANEALIKLLSDYFSVPKYNIKIIKGKRSKNKVVEISKP